MSGSSARPLRGELWWADLDAVVGRELGRKVRPVLVISYDEFSSEYERVIVVPGTTQVHIIVCHVGYDYRVGGRGSISWPVSRISRTMTAATLRAWRSSGCGPGVASHALS